jgi:hypothetical protein
MSEDSSQSVKPNRSFRPPVERVEIEKYAHVTHLDQGARCSRRRRHLARKYERACVRVCGLTETEAKVQPLECECDPHTSTSTRRDLTTTTTTRGSGWGFGTMREMDGDAPSPSNAHPRTRRHDDETDRATTSTRFRRGNVFIASTSEGAGDAHVNGASGASRAGYRNGPELYVTKNRAKTHRCNDRLEDVVQALFEGNPLLTVPPAWSLFVKCMRSEIGDEPRDPFLYHTPKWLEEQRAREKANKGRGWFGKS